MCRQVQIIPLHAGGFEVRMQVFNMKTSRLCTSFESAKTAFLELARDAVRPLPSFVQPEVEEVYDRR